MDNNKLTDELIRALNSEDESDRLYAAHDIALTKDQNAALHLVNRLQNETSQLVKDAIVHSLKAVSCSIAYDTLFSLFSSNDAYLRNQAVAVFGSEGNEAIPFLTSKLDHSNQEIRKLILDALFEIGTDESILAIRAYIHDNAQNVVIAAVEYLGRLNDKESVPELIDLFKSENEAMLRSSILDTLSLIGDADAIKTVVDIIKQQNAINSVSLSLYLPQLIVLVCKSGNKQEVITVIEAVGSNPMFSEEVIAGMHIALRRFPDILLRREMCDILLGFLSNNDVSDDVKLSVAEIIANKAYVNVLTQEELYSWGTVLLENPLLVIGGLNLLKACNTIEAHNRIDEELKSSQNTELRELYEDLLNDTSKQQIGIKADNKTPDNGAR